MNLLLHNIGEIDGESCVSSTDALVADNSTILATLPWRPQHADLDPIVRDALAWERKLAERSGP